MSICLASTLIRAPFASLFSINADGSITPLETVEWEGLRLKKGQPLVNELAVTGSRVAQLREHYFEVELREDDLYVIHGAGKIAWVR